MAVWLGLWRLFLFEIFPARRGARIPDDPEARRTFGVRLDRFLRQSWRLLTHRVWMHCDRPSLGPFSRPLFAVVAVEGWAVAVDGIASVTVSCDDHPLGEAAFGVRRRDLARLFPHIQTASRSGFYFVFDSRTLANGEHTLRVVVRTRKGRSLRLTGKIRVKNELSLQEYQRRRAEPTATALAWMRRNVAHLHYRPRVSVLIPLAPPGVATGLRRTIESLLDQSYADWESLLIGSEVDLATADVLIPPDARIHSIVANAPTRAETLSRGLEEMSGEIFTVLDPGDALSLAALFELVYAFNRHPELDQVFAEDAGDMARRWAVRRKLTLKAMAF